jgi:hypothetical protein
MLEKAKRDVMAAIDSLASESTDPKDLASKL